MKMKLTEVLIYPENKEGNKIIEHATVEGDFNLLNPMLRKMINSYNRKKDLYFFIVEREGAKYFEYNLDSKQFNTVKEKYNLKK